jgi:hypothetical protein
VGIPTYHLAAVTFLGYHSPEMATIITERTIKLDSKHRVTVRKPMAEHYRMEQYDDGRVVLSPMELISTETLKSMKKAVALVKEGVAGAPVDMSQVQAILEEPETDVCNSIRHS